MSKIIGNAILAGGSEYPRLKGTWVFNTTLSESATKGTTITGNVEFTSDSTSYATMTINYGSSYGTSGYSISDIQYDTTQVNNAATWANQAYRVITFTAPVKREGNEAFYDWFVSNAKRVKAKNLYGYKFTSGTEIPVTVPNHTLTEKGTQQTLNGTAPLFGVLCWHNADGNTSFANSDLCTKIGSRVRYVWVTSSLQGRYSYSYVSTTSINGDNYNIASKRAMSLTAPSSATVVSDVDNLYFADQPTGDLLTWLNTYATKI